MMIWSIQPKWIPHVKVKLEKTGFLQNMIPASKPAAAKEDDGPIFRYHYHK